MRLLITGAAGFIGSNFIRYWRRQYPNDYLILVDNLGYAGNLENLHGLTDDSCTFVKADINETELIIELLYQHKLDTLVNFAAQSHVDRSIGPTVYSKRHERSGRFHHHP